MGPRVLQHPNGQWSPSQLGKPFKSSAQLDAEFARCYLRRRGGSVDAARSELFPPTNLGRPRSATAPHTPLKVASPLDARKPQGRSVAPPPEVNRPARKTRRMRKSVPGQMPGWVQQAKPSAGQPPSRLAPLPVAPSPSPAPATLATAERAVVIHPAPAASAAPATVSAAPASAARRSILDSRFMKVALQVGKVTLSGLQFGGSFVIDCPLGFVASVVLSGLRLKLDLAPWRAACASLRDDAQALAASARALSAAAQGRAVMQAPQPQQLSDPVPPPTLDDPMWSNEFKDAFKKVDAFKNNKALHYAQRAWLMKSLTLGVTVAGTVLAAVATGLTGGAAAPALVVSTLALRFALANWRCAQQNLKLAEAGKPTLPMGNSAFGNALYTQYIQAGLPDRQARDEANRNAVLAGLLVTALGVGLGFGLAVSLPASAAEAMGGLRMTASLLKNCVLPGVDFVRGKWQAREVDTSDPGRVLRQAARDNWLAFLMNHPVRAAQYRDWLERRSSGMGGLAQALAIETVPAHAQRVAPRPLPSQFDHDTLDLDPLVEWTVGSSAARLNELAQHLGSDSDAWLREIAADLDSRQWRTRESLASDGIDAVFSLQGAISGIVGMA